MSMRPLIYPLSSLEPVRAAIGSRDESLVDRMVDAFARHYEVEPESPEARRFRDQARSFVEGKLRDGKEPGEWDESLHLVARSLGLLQSEYPINDDWK